MNTWIVFFAIIGCVFAQSPDGIAKIVSQTKDITPDGSYQWSYVSDNGISALEQGTFNTNIKEPSVEAQGEYQYTAPDGTPIALHYIADENGFKPDGAHLPTPPPVPVYIIRSLEWNAAHPEEV